jgi:hypothetical protein
LVEASAVAVERRLLAGEFTSPAQTDWLMRCTARKLLRTAEQEPVVPPLRGRAA